jgi:hypothetical protein
MSLYADKHPETSTKGVGFKDKQKALDTLKIIKKQNKIKQMQIVLTMYYRAEHHPHKNNNMKEAMEVFKKWLIKNGYKGSVL